MSNPRPVDNEQSPSDPETESSIRSSTPLFSDHSSDREDEQDENGYGNDLSGEHPRTPAEQQFDDNTPIRPSCSNNPTAVAPINQLSAPSAPTNENVPEYTNRCPKRVIKHRVQVNEAIMDDSDCANSDCDDPKRPGELIQCAGLGCRTKVHLYFVMCHTIHSLWLMWCSLVSLYMPPGHCRNRQLVL
jgi:hypothetical protein